VKLDEINGLDFHPLQTIIHKTGNILPIVTISGMWAQSATTFTGNEDFLTGFFDSLGNSLLTQAIRIDICGINEIDTSVDRCTDDFICAFRIKGLAPFATYLPGAEGYIRDFPFGFAEGSVVH